MEQQEIAKIKEEWGILIEKMSDKFNQELDLQGVIFLIGVQELGHGPREFSKNEKQDLMHIATCRLLSNYGYYILQGQDDEGWPHWEMVSELPALTLKEQDILLKQSVIEYLKDSGI